MRKKKLPYLYRLLLQKARECDELDRKYEAERNKVACKVASRFRLTRREIRIALKELEKQRYIERTNQRRIRIKP